MCFGWKFKLETLWGPQCWVEETGLGLDGCTGLSVMARKGTGQNGRAHQENDEPLVSIGGVGGWAHTSRVTRMWIYLKCSLTLPMGREGMWKLITVPDVAQGRREMGDPQAFGELMYPNSSSRLEHPSTLSRHGLKGTEGVGKPSRRAGSG